MGADDPQEDEIGLARLTIETNMAGSLSQGSIDVVFVNLF